MKNISSFEPGNYLVIGFDDSQAERMLNKMGIFKGSVVEFCINIGAVIIRKNFQKIAIGHDTAEKILIQKV